ncbi:winged helix-turn-helix domain-containing protein [Devosia sp. Root105]|uniref:winged helix-turn-helix domain-containing tetratricopeptide repeat protein n=1 Tax=Devosia sp. Root105 TaxID=1736423 RepID=UPI0009EC198F|nr:winged helix-turn-helix domain-containing protein [Devosia sp. Root105]
MAELDTIGRETAHFAMGERIAFGPYLFDTASAMLLRGGDVVSLGGRAATVLQVLLEADGEVVGKSHLMDRVWPDTVVEEGNLAVQVAALRRILGTRPDGAEWIGNVARVGYRLVRDAGGATTGIPAIAVLPFANLSGDRAEDYFVDGIVAELIAALSRFKSFAVIARNSSLAFKDRAVDVREVARALGARYLLEGSVRLAGPRVRVTAQLIDGASGSHLWAESFDGAVGDILDFQDRITEAVIGLIEPQLRRAEIERARRKRPENLDAYDLYLQALPFMQGVRIVQLEDFDRAIELLERAISLDPDFAPALALAAWAHEMRLTRGGTAPPGVDDARQAMALAARGLAADGNDPNVMLVAGIVRLTISGEHATGLALIRRAQAANPNSLLIANVSGYAHFFMGDYDGAIASHERFLQLSPGLAETFWSLNGIARAHLAAGRVEEALAWGLRGLEASEGVDFPHCIVAAAYAHLGRLDEAQAQLARAHAIWPSLTIASLLGRTGQSDGRDRVLVEGLRLAGLREG